MSHARRPEVRHSLLRAVITLTLESPYDLLTVQQILNRASVSRATFYHYYSNKEDLLIDCFREMKVLHIEQWRSSVSSGEVQWGDAGYLLQVLRHFDSHRVIWEAFRNQKAKRLLLRAMHELFRTLARKDFFHCDPGFDRRVVVPFAAAAHFTVVSWLEGELKGTPEEIAKLIRSAVRLPLG